MACLCNILLVLAYCYNINKPAAMIETGMKIINAAQFDCWLKINAGMKLNSTTESNELN